MVGRFCNFSFTYIKRLAMLLLGMHFSRLGGTMYCLHFWYFGMRLKANELEPEILRIMNNISRHFSNVVRVLSMYGL